MTFKSEKPAVERTADESIADYLYELAHAGPADVDREARMLLAATAITLEHGGGDELAALERIVELLPAPYCDRVRECIAELRSIAVVRVEGAAP